MTTCECPKCEYQSKSEPVEPVVPDNHLVRSQIRAIMDEIFRLQIELGERFCEEGDDEAGAIVHRIINRMRVGL